MRPHTDEVLAPIFKQHLGLLERVEDLAVQQFVPELTVEAFVVAVLPRASRFDKQSFGAHTGEPVAHFARGHFWAVI